MREDWDRSFNMVELKFPVRSGDVIAALRKELASESLARPVSTGRPKKSDKKV